MKEILTPDDAADLAVRWRDALHQMHGVRLTATEQLTEESIHRILGILLEEVVVAEGGAPKAPATVPFHKFERMVRAATHALALIARNGEAWSHEVAKEALKVIHEIQEE